MRGAAPGFEEGRPHGRPSCSAARGPRTCRYFEIGHEYVHELSVVAVVTMYGLYPLGT
jgi:hypothetical protein